MAFLAGYGVKLFLVTQDLSQLNKAYTRENSVVANAHIRIAYAPNTLETAKWLSEACGKRTVATVSHSYSGERISPFLKSTSQSVQYTGRELLTPDEAMKLPPDDMLIFVSGLAPIYGRKIKYYEDPDFLACSKVPTPVRSDVLRVAEPAQPAPARARAGLPGLADTEEIPDENLELESVSAEELLGTSGGSGRRTWPEHAASRDQPPAGAPAPAPGAGSGLRPYTEVLAEFEREAARSGAPGPVPAEDAEDAEAFVEPLAEDAESAGNRPATAAGARIGDLV